MGLTSGDPIFRPMWGRVPLSSDVSEIKLVFSIPPERPTPNFAAGWSGLISIAFLKNGDGGLLIAREH